MLTHFDISSSIDTAQVSQTLSRSQMNLMSMKIMNKKVQALIYSKSNYQKSCERK